MTKLISLILLLLVLVPGLAQLPRDLNGVVNRLESGSAVPKDLLSKRAVVIFEPYISDHDLEAMQREFQQTGIDAVGYFNADKVFAGQDILIKYANYFVDRDISFLVLFQKVDSVNTIFITPFNNEHTLVDEHQPAWTIQDRNLANALQEIYRTAVNDQERLNFLINDIPETDFNMNFIPGKRFDFYAIDLKVDKLAVPWMNDAEMDSALVAVLKENYPFRYGMVKPNEDIKTYSREGYIYCLGYVHAQGNTAKEILDYPLDSNESAITSVTYPQGQPELKTIASDKQVFKFYVTQIQTGNVFLGTKWDADVTLRDALINYVKGFKAELKIP